MISPRAPIDLAAVSRALAEPGRWQVEQMLVTGSSNAELAARANAPAGTVLLVEEQTSGRGRLGRQWQAPAGSSLMMSVVFRPDLVQPNRRGWIGFLVALAAVEALATAGIAADLKWPNDVVVNGDKIAGVLAEATPSAVVVGIGLNVTQTAAELPRPDATSVALACGNSDRVALSVALLDALGRQLDRWLAVAGDPLASGVLADYRRRCTSIGHRVRAELPAGPPLIGDAVDVTADGALVIRDDEQAEHAVLAADVVHLSMEPSGARS